MKNIILIVVIIFNINAISFSQISNLDSLDGIDILKQDTTFYNAFLIIIQKKEKKSVPEQIIVANYIVELLQENENLRTKLDNDNILIQNLCSDTTLNVFNDFSISEITIKKDENRIKINAILAVIELNVYYQNKIYYNQIENINDKIKYIEDISTIWSIEQKKYVNNLLQNIKNDIIFFEMVESEYNNLLTSKINKDDLLEIKKYYRELIQQKFIENKIKELELQ